MLVIVEAMDRAHRLGQTRQVTVYRLICKGTIEERILQRARYTYCVYTKPNRGLWSETVSVQCTLYTCILITVLGKSKRNLFYISPNAITIIKNVPLS